MLNDLNPKDFRNIYIVCGATDMRYGINGLSAIIEQKYKMNVFIGKTLFMFCGHNAKIMKVFDTLYTIQDTCYAGFCYFMHSCLSAYNPTVSPTS